MSAREPSRRPHRKLKRLLALNKKHAKEEEVVAASLRFGRRQERGAGRLLGGCEHIPGVIDSTPMASRSRMCAVPPSPSPSPPSVSRSRSAWWTRPTSTSASSSRPCSPSSRRRASQLTWPVSWAARCPPPPTSRRWPSTSSTPACRSPPAWRRPPPPLRPRPLPRPRPRPRAAGRAFRLPGQPFPRGRYQLSPLLTSSRTPPPVYNRRPSDMRTVVHYKSLAIFPISLRSS
ncbi:serine/arginine repetitive matrix protein 1-like [Penaeus indicus]|uniref:serine/arginine repetitive matrix protein 1-like n=1 Tax=Penaeus indicus TaxID=29960 RepID=UPI00300CEB6A